MRERKRGLHADMGHAGFEKHHLDGGSDEEDVISAENSSEYERDSPGSSSSSSGFEDDLEIDRDSLLPLGQRVQLYQRGEIALPKKHAISESKRRQKEQGGDETESQKEEEKNKKKKKKVFTREHKHRPVEMSSKKPVSVLRDSLLGLGDGSGMKKKRVRDPRFDSLSGKYEEKDFKKRYSFVFDEKLPEERRELKESLSKIKSARKKERLQKKLQKVTQQLKTEEARRRKESRREKVLEAHKQATRGQSRKYHLKKSEIKKQELLLQYKELKESGQLQKYMEKRRRKNSAKDHRYLPMRKDA
ncbi:hypothetical protein M9434_006523 [Picochlorum sp. BPE23]|nr:hypothetical protein M9434_006523 [Picochlorum sp. BPE23]